jgi:hypothetical protein
LVATETYPVRDWKVYEPSKRDIITNEFEWDIITEIDPETQLWYIANNIQRDVDVGLYKIGGLENRDKKSSELIDEIKKQFKLTKENSNSFDENSFLWNDEERKELNKINK